MISLVWKLGREKGYLALYFVDKKENQNDLASCVWNFPEKPIIVGLFAIIWWENLLFLEQKLKRERKTATMTTIFQYLYL